MNLGKIKDFNGEIILFSIIIFSLIINLVVLVPSENFLRDDNLGSFRESVFLYRDFDKRIQQTFQKTTHVPFFLITTLPFYFIFDVSVKTAIMNSSLYFIILILSIYGIAKKLYGKKHAILSSLTAAFTPAIFGYSRTYSSNFGGAALVALSILLLLKTEFFENRRYSLLFGISTGLSILARWPSVFFILPVFLFYLSKYYRDKRNLNLHNLVYSSFTALFIPLTYLLPIAREFFKVVREKTLTQPSCQVSQESLSLIEKTFFQANLINDYFLFTVLSTFFIISLIFVLLDFNKKDLLLSTWIFVPYILLTAPLLINPCDAFKGLVLIQSVPAMALIIPLFLRKISNPMTKKLFGIIFVCLIFSQFFLITFNPILPKWAELEKLKKKRDYSDPLLYTFPEENLGASIAKTFSEETESGAVRIYYLIHPGLIWEVSPSDIEDYSVLHGLEIEYLKLPYRRWNWKGNSMKFDKNSNPNSFFDVDFVIYSKTNNTESSELSKEYKDAVKAFERTKDKFEKIEEYKTKDHGKSYTLIIYRKSS